MIRVLLILIIGFLLYRGIRGLVNGMARSRETDERPQESVADLRACARCGTFVEFQQLDAHAQCHDCSEHD